MLGRDESRYFLRSVKDPLALVIAHDSHGQKVMQEAVILRCYDHDQVDERHQKEKDDQQNIASSEQSHQNDINRDHRLDGVFSQDRTDEKHRSGDLHKVLFHDGKAKDLLAERAAMFQKQRNGKFKDQVSGQQRKRNDEKRKIDQERVFLDGLRILVQCFIGSVIAGLLLRIVALVLLFSYI